MADRLHKDAQYNYVEFKDMAQLDQVISTPGNHTLIGFPQTQEQAELFVKKVGHLPEAVFFSSNEPKTQESEENQEHLEV